MTFRFISFEGGEGSGKSTQIALLEKAFAQAGIGYVRTREPGGSKGAETIRNLLVTGHADSWNPLSETLLFYAARLDHVERLIKPALDKGQFVICDRFADSTLVYQGVGKGLSENYVRMLHQLLLGNFAPALTFMLDIEPAEGLKRAGNRTHNETRFESMNLDFHRQIRAGFLAIAQRESARCRVLDASQSQEALHAHIVQAVNERFGVKLAVQHG